MSEALFQKNNFMISKHIHSSKRVKSTKIICSTGEILLKEVLDREEKSIYKFTIAAIDNGGKMGFATVVVQVKDENDNVPQFLMEEYRSNVASNASIGTVVIKVLVM